MHVMKLEKLHVVSGDFEFKNFFFWIKSSRM